MESSYEAYLKTWNGRMKNLIGAAFEASLIDSYGMHVLMEAVERQAYKDPATAYRIIQDIKAEQPRK
jgi:hypothetical protein